MTLMGLIHMHIRPFLVQQTVSKGGVLIRTGIVAVLKADPWNAAEWYEKDLLKTLSLEGRAFQEQIFYTWGSLCSASIPLLAKAYFLCKPAAFSSDQPLRTGLLCWLLTFSAVLLSQHPAVDNTCVWDQISVRYLSRACKPWLCEHC